MQVCDNVGNCTTAGPIGGIEVTLGQSSQAITFAALADMTMAQSPFTVSATASSGLPVTFTTLQAANCTASGVNGTTITLLKPGTCTVVASQAGNPAYKAAPPVRRSFGVTRAHQTITFAPLANGTLAQSPFTVSATASSGLPVTFNTTSGICTSSGVNGATITLVRAGTCTVKATQAGTSVYWYSAAATQSFTVSKAP